MDVIEQFEDPEHAELLSSYQEMASGQDRENEALEWCEALLGEAFIEE
jgi:hypothetical protein